MTAPTTTLSNAESGAAPQAISLTVGGRVQGVGFRPFVYRLAHRLGLCGWVRNESGTVEIFLQGPAPALTDFERGLIAEAPPLAQARITSRRVAPPEALETFTILPSRDDTPARVHVPPDYFACEECLQ